MTLDTQHSTLQTPHSDLYTPHSTPYILHSTLHTLHFTLHTLHLTPRTLHSTLCTPHCNYALPFTVYAVRCTLHTLYTLQSTRYTLHFALSTLYTLHFTLHPHSFTLFALYAVWNLGLASFSCCARTPTRTSRPQLPFCTALLLPALPKVHSDAEGGPLNLPQSLVIMLAMLNFLIPSVQQCIIIICSYRRPLERTSPQSVRLDVHLTNMPHLQIRWSTLTAKLRSCAVPFVFITPGPQVSDSYLSSINGSAARQSPLRHQLHQLFLAKTQQMLFRDTWGNTVVPNM